jgi:hypothetical protein
MNQQMAKIGTKTNNTVKQSSNFYILLKYFIYQSFKKIPKANIVFSFKIYKYLKGDT